MKKGYSWTFAYQSPEVSNHYLFHIMEIPGIMEFFSEQRYKGQPSRIPSNMLAHPGQCTVLSELAFCPSKVNEDFFQQRFSPGRHGEHFPAQMLVNLPEEPRSSQRPAADHDSLASHGQSAVSENP